MKKAIMSLKAVLPNEGMLIITDNNRAVHNVGYFDECSTALIEWLSATGKVKSAEFSYDEGGILVDLDCGYNETCFLLDGENRMYYPDYTDHYFSGKAEEGLYSFDEKLAIVKEHSFAVSEV